MRAFTRQQNGCAFAPCARSAASMMAAAYHMPIDGIGTWMPATHEHMRRPSAPRTAARRCCSRERERRHQLHRQLIRSRHSIPPNLLRTPSSPKLSALQEAALVAHLSGRSADEWVLETTACPEGTRCAKDEVCAPHTPHMRRMSCDVRKTARRRVAGNSQMPQGWSALRCLVHAQCLPEPHPPQPSARLTMKQRSPGTRRCRRRPR